MSKFYPRDWEAISIKMPIKAKKELKKFLIDQDQSLSNIVISLTAAVLVGEIIIQPNPLLGGVAPNVMKSGSIQDCKVIFKSMSGEVLNPSPINEKIIL
jgi:hypothetical protein